MIKKCTISVIDEVWCHITGLQPSEHEILWKNLAPHTEGYFFHPKFKMGQWDGRIRFYQKTGKTYIRLLDKILPYLESWGYEVQLVDKRAYYEPPEPVGQLTAFDERGLALTGEGLDIFGDVETRPGKRFELRPYQLQAINAAVEAGSGFVIGGTGMGKCVSGCTTINIRASAQLKKAIENVRAKNLSHLQNRE